MAFSRIAVQHADDGYSRRGKFGRALLFTIIIVLTYSPDDTNVYGSRGWELEGIGSV